MHLDFSIITDDQLIDLIRAACAEAIIRGMATQQAAETAMLDETERARIAHAATVRAHAALAQEEAHRIAQETERRIKAEAEAAQRKAEQEKVAETWAYKEQVGVQLAEILRPKRARELKVWLKGADKRIYIGGGFRENDVEYFHTGNHREKPGTLRWDTGNSCLGNRDRNEVKAQLRLVLEELCQRWNSIIIPIPAWSARHQEVA